VTLSRSLVVAAMLVAGAAPHASELSRFHDDVADAYAFYRSAAFYLGNGNAMVAGFELEQMRERWRVLTARYAQAPPDAYSDLPDFAATLAAIDARIASAAAGAAGADAEAAAKALAPVRRTLATLRARAGVRVFSDCIDEVNAAMDALYVYRRAEPLDVEDLAQVNDVKAKAAVLGYVLERCDAAADAAVREDPEFRRLVDGMLASSAAVFPALDRKDTAAVINLLRELRSFDRILYLRSG
jgi:hypothetical protein